MAVTALVALNSPEADKRQAASVSLAQRLPFLQVCFRIILPSLAIGYLPMVGMGLIKHPTVRWLCYLT